MNFTLKGQPRLGEIDFFKNFILNYLEKIEELEIDPML